MIVNGGKVIAENGFSNNSFDGAITLNATLICDVYYKLTCSNTISGVGGLTKTQTGPMVLTGTNTYTGPTTVTGGTLQCDNMNALGSGALSISGTGKMNLNYPGTKSVASLTLGGVAKTASGTYGSVASGADFQNDTYFVGTGTVTVVSATASVYHRLRGQRHREQRRHWRAWWWRGHHRLDRALGRIWRPSSRPTRCPPGDLRPDQRCPPRPRLRRRPGDLHRHRRSHSVNAYTVTVTVTPASTAKVMSKVYFPGYGYAWATSANGFPDRSCPAPPT